MRDTELGLDLPDRAKMFPDAEGCKDSGLYPISSDPLEDDFLADVRNI